METPWIFNLVEHFTPFSGLHPLEIPASPYSDNPHNYQTFNIHFLSTRNFAQINGKISLLVSERIQRIPRQTVWVEFNICAY